MPFDQFTIEQIRWDLLPNATVSQKIATGFHRNHRTNAEGGIRARRVSSGVRRQIEWRRLPSYGWPPDHGLPRCHDHKYDPMKQRDFYRMFAFFNHVPEKGLVYKLRAMTSR